MNNNELQSLLPRIKMSQNIRNIASKVLENQRITTDEGLALFTDADLPLLSVLATAVRRYKNGDKVYFNRNFHIEPTNICIYDCSFCSFARKIKDTDAWEYSIDDIVQQAEKYKDKNVTEAHIVGGVHPHRNLHYYGEMMAKIKKVLPHIHIKAFTAVELDFMIRKAGMSIADGLLKLKEYGLDSIPGGGAEIFDEELRKTICETKVNTQLWLEIHEKAHNAGIPSNATILYGHIETYAHRIDHLNRLRTLQDKTGGFNTFIPLKYRKENNSLSHAGEVNTIEDLRNYAVSRIFLDNFGHIKAYWPMIGKQTTQLSLSFGVDDVDGTIDDTTKIYSMAGAEDKSPTMNTEELILLIQGAGYKAVERDTVYNTINTYI